MSDLKSQWSSNIQHTWRSSRSYSTVDKELDFLQKLWFIMLVGGANIFWFGTGTYLEPPRINNPNMIIVVGGFLFQFLEARF